VCRFGIGASARSPPSIPSSSGWNTRPRISNLDWLAGLEADFEQRYQEVKRAREGQEERRKRALRQEPESQGRPQPELERRFKKQEAERKRREEEAREEREREKVERDIALIGGGFNF
jgi:hypothetical protein